MRIKNIFDKPMYILDFEIQFSDLLDFIEFSEHNLDWQKRSHIQRLEKETGLLKYDAENYFHELQNIEYRFDINLPKKIRYASLGALITTFDWLATFIENNLTWKIKTKDQGVNKSIHIITELLEKNKYGKNYDIKKIETLIKIRNCITHNGGVVEGYKYEKDIKHIVENTDGFSIPEEGIPKNSIYIDKGVIESIIIEITTWLIPYIEECQKSGLIKPCSRASVKSL